MVKEITENELVEIVSEKQYYALIEAIFLQIEKSGEYKKVKNYICTGTMVLNQKMYLYAETTVFKKKCNGENNSFDFRFTKIVITDEIDYILDRQISIKSFDY